MTERFIVDDAGTLIDMQTRDMFDIVEEVVDLLNALSDGNEELKEALKELKEIGDYQSDRIQELNDENEQLKQRNDRQAKRLAELYELMAKKDWESLTEIIDDFCSCEEQLQRESGTYW